MFTEAEKFYIDCPYSEKNACKALGGKWDGNAKSWYIPEGLNHSNFTRWIQIRAYHVRTGNKHCPQALDKRIKASEMGRLIKPGQVAQLLSSTIKQAMDKHNIIKTPSLDEIMNIDKQVKEATEESIKDQF